MSNSTGNNVYGLLTEFDNVKSLMKAAEQVRDKGFQNWDAHTPFAVHGLDKAMGIRGTRLPFLVLAGGFTGLGLATLMQWWMNAVDYKFVISGKPLFGIPANVPIMFEITVLLSAFAAFFGMWVLNDLPKWYHPLFTNKRFSRVTQDRFFIVIEAKDPQFDLAKTRDFLATLGGAVVEEVNESAED